MGAQDVRTLSYINNLHPAKYPALYKVIENVVGRSIVLWDEFLGRAYYNHCSPRIEMTGDGYDPDFIEPEPEYDEDGYEALYEDWQNRRPIVQPEPSSFESPEFTEMPDVEKLRKESCGCLQIIVKLANIHLTTENPTYPGGTWHTEGQANENICASSIYYYSSENVSDSFLRFRQGRREPYDLDYAQDDYRAVETIYGFENRGPAIQELGSIKTCQGRLIAFANTLQHQVQPFSLIDRSRPGYRKILALFLVDPHQRIISTANVPCQQKEWWAEVVSSIGPLGSTLPPELTRRVMDYVDIPITMEKAKEQRSELMKERSQFVVESNHNLVQSYTYSVSTSSLVPCSSDLLSILFSLFFTDQHTWFATARGNDDDGGTYDVAAAWQCETLCLSPPPPCGHHYSSCRYEPCLVPQTWDLEGASPRPFTPEEENIPRGVLPQI